jgi:hypothetical protein
MKLIKITLILLIGGCIYRFVTSGKSFHIARTLPFCSGEPVNRMYEIGGLVMLGLFFWGLYRLNRNTKDDDE